MKGKRQIVFATHNANIPVLGDSEQIFSLDTFGKACILVHKGSIDINEVRYDVKNIIEGGEGAFTRRAEKYGEVR
jgi:hypothetical protein